MTLKYAASWSAGFFDGEGSIGVSQPADKRRTMQLCLTAYQNHPGPLHRLRGLWGGSVGTVRARGSSVKGYRWRLGGWERVEQAIQQWEPFLIVKREQVKAILDFMEDERQLDPLAFSNRRGRNRITDEAMQRRQDLREKLKAVRYGV